MRCLSLLESLRELGCSTVLLTSNLAEDPWTPTSIEALRSSLVEDVRVYRLGRPEATLRLGAQKWAGLRARLGRPSLESWAVTPPGYRRWSHHQAESVDPDVLLSFYATFDALVPHRRARLGPLVDRQQRPRVCLAGDVAQAPPVLRRKSPLATTDVPDEVLTEAFLDAVPRRLDHELEIYDRYSDVLAISKKETEIIQQGTQRTKVHYVPMAVDIVAVDNTYDGNAVFVGAPNPFNLQGLLWFARHVLPLVRNGSADVHARRGRPARSSDGRLMKAIVLHGSVHELDPFYRTSAFAICPLLAGTGEQVKIIDAMAHGLAVVATRISADSSPIVDGVNGYIVDSAEEFAARVVELWSDHARRRVMGEAAREAVRAERSQARTTAELEQILR